MNEAVHSAGHQRDRSGAQKKGLLARIRLFFRQVAGELKKVVRPSRKELINLFITVLVFVAIVMVIVTIIDVAFGELVFMIFG